MRTAKNKPTAAAGAGDKQPRADKRRFDGKLFCAVVAMVVICGIGHPRAAWGAREWTLGGGGVYRSVNEGRGFVLAEMDVLEVMGVRVEAALGAAAHQPVGVVWLGPTLSLDIWSWAPTLFTGVGWRASPHTLTGTLRAEVRRYLSLHAGLGIGVGGEWSYGQPAQLCASLAYFYRLEL